MIIQNSTLQVAAVMLQSAELREDIADTAKNQARAQRDRAREAEVGALHDAADKTALGGWTGAGLSVAGGGMQVVGSLELPAGTRGPVDGFWDEVRLSGEILGQLAPSVRAVVGDAPAQHAQAVAAAQRGNADQASDAASDAADAERSAQDQQTRLIASAESSLQADHAAQNAVIGNIRA